MKHNQGSFSVFDASTYKVGIVCTKFNGEITDKILVSALGRLREYKITQENIDIFLVPGAVEIPVLLQNLAQKKKYDCLIAVAAIIRGTTDHYDYVAKIVSEGVLRVMLDNTMPIGFGVLTTQNQELALSRCSIGADAVVAALHTRKEMER